MSYPIPRRSAQAYEKHQNAPGQNQNPGLIFDRFSPDWGLDPLLKGDGLQAVKSASTRIDTELLKAQLLRWSAAAAALGARIFTFKTDWRLIAGFGRKGTLEVGFAFNRYGFPELPGSGLKGLARAWGRLAVAEALGTQDLTRLDKILSEDDPEKFSDAWQEAYPKATAVALALVNDFRILFGTTACAGRASFLSAVPDSTHAPVLDADILNPHYPKYYAGGGTYPIDGDSPIPVKFLTVAAGTQFWFAIACRDASQLQPAEVLRLLNLAEKWLTLALQKLGAGAKTAGGYGFFDANQTGLSPLPEPPEYVIPQPDVIEVRQGVITGMRPDRRTGWLRDKDDATGEPKSFSIDVITPKGRTPGRGAVVTYTLTNGKITEVKV